MSGWLAGLDPSAVAAVAILGFVLIAIGSLSMERELRRMRHRMETLQTRVARLERTRRDAD